MAQEKVYVAKSCLKVSKKGEAVKHCKPGQIYEGPDAEKLLKDGHLVLKEDMDANMLADLEKKVAAAKKELSELQAQLAKSKPSKAESGSAQK